MPIITRIAETKRTPNRRSVHLDGSFAFACNINVVARFRLAQGMTLSEQQVQAIQQGEVRQECFDKAMSFLQLCLHSRAELRKKLLRHEFAAILIDEVLEELSRLGYVDDVRFAKTKALSASQHKHHGRRWAFMELLKSGVKGDVAERRWMMFITRPIASPMRRLREAGSTPEKTRSGRRASEAGWDASEKRIRLRDDQTHYRGNAWGRRCIIKRRAARLPQRTTAPDRAGTARHFFPFG